MYETFYECQLSSNLFKFVDNFASDAGSHVGFLQGFSVLFWVKIWNFALVSLLSIWSKKWFTEMFYRGRDGICEYVTWPPNKPHLKIKAEYGLDCLDGRTRSVGKANENTRKINHIPLEQNTLSPGILMDNPLVL